MFRWRRMGPALAADDGKFKSYSGSRADLCRAGVEFRAPLGTSAPLQRVLARLRQDVATMADDRYLAPDLLAACQLVASTEMTKACQLLLPELATPELAWSAPDSAL